MRLGVAQIGKAEKALRLGKAREATPSRLVRERGGADVIRDEQWGRDQIRVLQSGPRPSLGYRPQLRPDEH